MTVPDNEERIAELGRRLERALAPSHCEIIDDSHLHVGHVGARDGRAHLRVIIRSGRFAGLPPVARHRLVYEAAGDLMQSDIHALSIDARPG